MEGRNGKSSSSIRRDERNPQITELSMIYEGSTEDISVRPPDLSPAECSSIRRRNSRGELFSNCALDCHEAELWSRLDVKFGISPEM
jgi:hypothetical protein